MKAGDHTGVRVSTLYLNLSQTYHPHPVNIPSMHSQTCSTLQLHCMNEKQKKLPTISGYDNYILS